VDSSGNTIGLPAIDRQRAEAAAGGIDNISVEP
jgi:hypothetical protein